MEDRLSKAFADEPVPPHLWPRIQASLAEIDLRRTEPSASTSAHSARRWTAYRAWMPIAAMLLLVIAGTGLLTRSAMVPGITPWDVATVPIDEFRTFEASGRPLDFTSGEPAEVRRWFLAKVDLPLPIPVAETMNARLTGGRLCYFLDRRIASFMYVLNDQSLSLYIMSTADLPVPARAETKVVYDENYTAVLWVHGDLAYVLVSRLTGDNAVELLRGMTPSTQA